MRHAAHSQKPSLMTRSDALSIIDNLPKSLSDIAVQIETHGVDAMLEAFHEVDIDGDEMILALEDDLVDSLSEYPLAQESLEDQLFRFRANRTFHQIAERCNS